MNIGEFFKQFATEESNLKGTWPHFRGADYDNIAKNSVPLKNNWTGAQPEIRWSVELGEGHAGAAIWDGRVYVMDYIEASRNGENPPPSALSTQQLDLNLATGS